MELQLQQLHPLTCCELMKPSRCGMCHELLTQRALFVKGTLSQHFMTRVVPPLPRCLFCTVDPRLSEPQLSKPSIIRTAN